LNPHAEAVLGFASTRRKPWLPTWAGLVCCRFITRSTRVYLHLGADWLAGEYKRAAEAIEAQATVGAVR
jgi:hypothetical protein